MKTKYQDIPWFEWKYWISTDWEVYSYPKRHWPTNALYKGKIVKSWNNRNYRQIKLLVNWKIKAQSIHRLVAITYLPNTENKPWINHKNWNPSDNRVENLEWCTISENTLHGYRVLWRKQTAAQIEWARKLGTSKGKKVMQLTKEGILCKIYPSTENAAKALWLFWTNIRKCIAWKYHTCWWYLWKYC